MPRSPFPLPKVLYRSFVPLIGLALLTVFSGPVLAGNQNGPGWQQTKPRTTPKTSPKPWKKTKAKPAPAADLPPATAASPLVPDVPAVVQPIAPRRTAPDHETIEREIPGNGPLMEDELIRLAIANHPELARRRAEILVARARIQGAGDWKNPELRIGYAWDHDDRLSEPFFESATESITASEQFSSIERQRNLAPELGESSLQRTSGSLNTTRYRDIETRVTPGRYRDVVETTTYERRSARESSRQSTANSFNTGSNPPSIATITSNEAGSQDTQRRIVEQSRKVISHPDEYSRDDQLSLTMRFQLPHYFERRARIELAAARTARAESDYLIEEDKVVRNVRALYEDLNMAENVARASTTRLAWLEKERVKFEAIDAPELVGFLADIRLEVGKSRRDEREFRSDIARQRQEIASYVGLDRPERIGITGKAVRRIVPVDTLDVDYLISMAQLHRSDLLDLESRLSVAKAELKGARAAQIPFFSFVDLGWANSQTTGRSGQSEEKFVRFGVTVPFFEWFGLNKAHLEHRTASDVYTRQIEAQRRLIGIEIRTAIDRIRQAAGELADFDKKLAQTKADAATSIEQTRAVELPKNSDKTKYQHTLLLAEFENDRFEVWSDYYKAVMELERALGTRLESVFSR